MQREGKDHPKSTIRRVSPQSLLRGEYVTLSKARDLLGGAEWRSLRKWIAQLRIKTYAHPTDGRIVLLRMSDVAKIAKISDRPFQEPERERTRVSSRAALERRLAELQQQQQSTIDDYERRLAELQQQHAQEVETLHQRISALQQTESS